MNHSFTMAAFRDTSPPAVTLAGVSKSYGSYRAVAALELSIAKGEFVGLVGPSGCGKSTLLNMIAGFMPPCSGDLRVEGQVFGGPAPFVGYMFQKDTVLPWYSVRRNIGLGPRYRKQKRAEVERRTDRLLALGRLEKFADAYPHQLSGGMRRRVALLMSLARDPRILMLDEPFGAPDAHTRTSLHAELVRKPHSFNVESISIGVPKKNELIQPCVAANCQMTPKIAMSTSCVENTRRRLIALRRAALGRPRTFSVTG